MILFRKSQLYLVGANVRFIFGLSLVYLWFIYDYVRLPDGQNRTSENRFFNFSQSGCGDFFFKYNTFYGTHKHYPTAFEAKKKSSEKYFFLWKLILGRARDIEIEFERERERDIKKKVGRANPRVRLLGTKLYLSKKHQKTPKNTKNSSYVVIWLPDT